MAFKELERVDRQMKLYGLNDLQRQVVIDLFFRYIDATVAQAITIVNDQLLAEIFSKDHGKAN